MTSHTKAYLTFDAKVKRKSRFLNDLNHQDPFFFFGTDIFLYKTRYVH